MGSTAPFPPHLTKKFMPAGLVAGLGVVGLLYNGKKARLEYDLL